MIDADVGWTMRLVVVLAGGLIGTGCPAAPRASTSSVTEPAAAHPLCGVLIDLAPGTGADETGFLLPTTRDAPEVRRYTVVNKTQHPAPLVVYAGWWMCITAGQITAEPDSAGGQYGTIEIADFAIDQRTGERGQE